MSSNLKIAKRIYWQLRRSNLRGIIFSVLYKGFHFPLIIRKGGKFKNLRYLYAGKKLVLDDHVELFINPQKGEMARLYLGNNVSIGRYSSIGCSREVIIEDDVTLAPYVHITDRNHEYEDIEIPIVSQPVKNKSKIIIGSQSWLGYGVQIMPGVKIGKHCVIAAGSVVTKNIPSYSVAGGIPAKVIKQYNFKTKIWEVMNSEDNKLKLKAINPNNEMGGGKILVINKLPYVVALLILRSAMTLTIKINSSRYA